MSQLYFGKKIHHREDFSYLLETAPRPMLLIFSKTTARFLWNISARNMVFMVLPIIALLQWIFCRKTAHASAIFSM